MKMNFNQVQAKDGRAFATDPNFRWYFLSCDGNSDGLRTSTNYQRCFVSDGHIWINDNAVGRYNFETVRVLIELKDDTCWELWQ